MTPSTNASRRDEPERVTLDRISDLVDTFVFAKTGFQDGCASVVATTERTKAAQIIATLKTVRNVLPHTAEEASLNDTNITDQHVTRRIRWADVPVDNDHDSGADMFVPAMIPPVQAEPGLNPNCGCGKADTVVEDLSIVEEFSVAPTVDRRSKPKRNKRKGAPIAPEAEPGLNPSRESVKANVTVARKVSIATYLDHGTPTGVEQLFDLAVKCASISNLKGVNERMTFVTTRGQAMHLLMAYCKKHSLKQDEDTIAKSTAKVFERFCNVAAQDRLYARFQDILGEEIGRSLSR